MLRPAYKPAIWQFIAMRCGVNERRVTNLLRYASRAQCVRCSVMLCKCAYAAALWRVMCNLQSGVAGVRLERSGGIAKMRECGMLWSAQQYRGVLPASGEAAGWLPGPATPNARCARRGRRRPRARCNAARPGARRPPGAASWRMGDEVVVGADDGEARKLDKSDPGEQQMSAEDARSGRRGKGGAVMAGRNLLTRPAPEAGTPGLKPAAGGVVNIACGQARCRRLPGQAKWPDGPVPSGSE